VFSGDCLRLRSQQQRRDRIARLDSHNRKATFVEHQLRIDVAFRAADVEQVSQNLRGPRWLF
jgi:hypothetical protein